MIKSIGVGGTSIFSAEINKTPPMEKAPHEQLMEEKNIDKKEEIQDDAWFNMYG